MQSNLPPGVTESMIPGNRLEDVWWEQLLDSVFVELANMGLDCVNRFDERRVCDLIEKHALLVQDPTPERLAYLVREALEGE